MIMIHENISHGIGPGTNGGEKINMDGHDYTRKLERQYSIALGGSLEFRLFGFGYFFILDSEY